MKYLLYNLKPIKGKRKGVLCLDCGWMRVSHNRHDYVTCPCPNETMVDGGNDYLRYGGVDMKRIQVITIEPNEGEK